MIKIRRIKPKHKGIFATNPCLGLICGKTGSGKTYLLMQALLQEDLLDYDSLYIFTSTPDQPAYQFLQHGFRVGLSKEAIGSIFSEYLKNDKIDMTVANFCEEFQNDQGMKGEKEKVSVHLSSKALPQPEDLQRNKKHVVIFDDCVNQRDQSLQKEYYTRGRHMNCTVFYLTQRYYDVPKIIRDNSNLVILFRQPHKSLTLLFNELDARNTDKLRLIAHDAWSKKHHYIAINTALEDDENITTDVLKEDESDLD